MSSPANPLQGTRSLLRFRANMQGLGWGHTLERVGLAGAKMSCRPLISALIFVIVLNAQIFAAEPRPGAPKTYPSPDQTLCVFVVPLPNAPYGQGESRIEMRVTSSCSRTALDLKTESTGLESSKPPGLPIRSFSSSACRAQAGTSHGIPPPTSWLGVTTSCEASTTISDPLLIQS